MIGSASEDRGRIMDTLRQLSDSRNWSNTREGFLRETSPSSVSQVSTSASGLSRSLTEAESYTREARRAEELARSEERRVGKESVSTCRSRGSPDHSKQNESHTRAHIGRTQPTHEQQHESILHILTHNQART